MPPFDGQPDSSFLRAAGRAVPPLSIGWAAARRRWLEANRQRLGPDADVERSGPVGIGGTPVAQLPSPLQLLPDVHRGGEIAGLHVSRIRGREAVVFEHAWTIGLVQTALKVRTVTAAVEVPPWPAVRITPRRAFRRSPRPGELRLEHESFTRRFRVRADDEDFAILLLNPDLQAWLATGPRAVWQIVPGALAMTRPGRLRPDDDDVEGALGAVESFVERVVPEAFDWGR